MKSLILIHLLGSTSAFMLAGPHEFEQRSITARDLYSPSTGHYLFIRQAVPAQQVFRRSFNDLLDETTLSRRAHSPPSSPRQGYPSGSPRSGAGSSPRAGGSSAPVTERISLSSSSSRGGSPPHQGPFGTPHRAPSPQPMPAGARPHQPPQQQHMSDLQRVTEHANAAGKWIKSNPGTAALGCVGLAGCFVGGAGAGALAVGGPLALGGGGATMLGAGAAVGGASLGALGLSGVARLGGAGNVGGGNPAAVGHNEAPHAGLLANAEGLRPMGPERPHRLRNPGLTGLSPGSLRPTSSSET